MILATHGIISSSGGSINYDTDALAFMTAASITDNTQKTAINTLVTDLKGYNIWTKMKAIYPFIGGTATTHKWNLKDPRDLDAAYRLVFNGGWTHSNTGALPNGTTGYTLTNLNARNNLSLSTNHFSYYSRTSSVLSTTVEMGVFSSEFAHLRAAVNYVAGGLSSVTPFTTTANSLGFWVGNKTADDLRKTIFNGNVESTNVTGDSSLYPNLDFYIGARNDNGTAAVFSDKECAFASIGDGLTDTEASDFYTAVQKYQTTLSRNV